MKKEKKEQDVVRHVMINGHDCTEIVKEGEGKKLFAKLRKAAKVEDEGTVIECAEQILGMLPKDKKEISVKEAAEKFDDNEWDMLADQLEGGDPIDARTADSIRKSVKARKQNRDASGKFVKGNKPEKCCKGKCKCAKKAPFGKPIRKKEENIDDAYVDAFLRRMAALDAILSLLCED